MGNDMGYPHDGRFMRIGTNFEDVSVQSFSHCQVGGWRKSPRRLHVSRPYNFQIDSFLSLSISIFFGFGLSSRHPAKNEDFCRLGYHCPKKGDAIAVKTFVRYLTGTRDVGTFISSPSRIGLDSFRTLFFAGF